MRWSLARVHPAFGSRDNFGSGRSWRLQKADWLIAALLMGVVTCLPAVASAETTISQGYATTDQLTAGSIVSLKNNTTDHVEAASSKNVGSMFGVAINDGNSLLTLSGTDSSQVQIATSGIVQVLVSDINGGISQGDEITASPINGVGMKATDNIKVVGIAQSDLNASSGSKQTYKDKSGTHSVLIGQIPVALNVTYFYKQAQKSIVPGAIQNVANALAGKKVNTLPIIICIGIFIITLIVVVSIIYSMIRSSIISVGRNPMSQSAIYRDLVQMSALVLVILSVSFATMYMVLTKF